MPAENEGNQNDDTPQPDPSEEESQPPAGGSQDQSQPPSSENTGETQTDVPSENSSGSSDGDTDLGGDSQPAPSEQNLVGSATYSLSALKSLFGAASSAPADKDVPEFCVAAGTAECFAFTIALPADPIKKEIAISEKKVSLYGKDQNPESDPPLEIPSAGIDPHLVYGLKYECSLNEDLSLADVAGESIIVDLKDFSSVFQLGELGADGTTQDMTLTIEDTSVVLGRITLDSKAATATITYLDAAALQANLAAAVSDAKIDDVTNLSAAFWLSCSFDSDGEHDTEKTHVTIGSQQIGLDWSSLPVNTPLCDIEKTVGSYDGGTQTLIWNVRLTPSNGATLANALFTDTFGGDLSFDPTTAEALTIRQGDTVHKIANQNADDQAPLAAGIGQVTYQFPSDPGELAGIDLTQELTVTVKTTVTDSFFAENLGTAASVSNTASIQDQKQEEPFPSKESSGEKSFETAWFSKTGEQYSGAHADEVGWSIELNAPVQMKDVLVYDLLPEQLGVKTASDGGLTLGQVTWQDASLTTDQSAADRYEIIPVRDGERNDSYPSGLNEDILSMEAGTTRYLVIFHLSSVPAGSQAVKFYAPLTINNINGDSLNIKNKAYLKAGSVGSGGAGGGWVDGEQGSASVTVDYTQAAIEKTGSYNRSNHHLIWNINVNNNKSVLTGGVRVTDTIGETLVHEGWEGTFDPAADLIWWAGDSSDSAVSMAALKTVPEPKDYPDIPHYTYDNGLLTIYVKEMKGETYHFKIDTEILGDKAYTCYYNEDAVQNNLSNQGHSANISNTATLTFDDKNVEATATVTLISKFLAKEAFRRIGSNAVEVPYDPADNTFWWKIQINADQRPMSGTADGSGGPTITDSLPKGVSYADYELCSVITYDYNSHYMGMGQILETGATDRNSAMLTVTEQDSQVQFTFKKPIREGYILFVKTKLNPPEMEDKTFTNKCSISFYENGIQHGADASNISRINIEGVSKSGEQVFEHNKAIYEARWTMDVNRDGLANGFEAPTITDVLPEGCTLQKNADGTYNVSIKKLQVTVKLAGRTTAMDSAVPVGEELAGTLADCWDYDQDTGTFTFRLPPDVPGSKQYSAYRVTLVTDIDADKAGTTMQNNASYTGIMGDETASSDSVKVYFFGVAAGGVWNKPPAEEKTKTIRIVKLSSQTDDQGLKPTLQGAQFELSFTLNGKQTVWKVTTDENGRAVVQGIPAAAANITLTEVKAPDGYVLPANPVLSADFEEGVVEQELLIENDPMAEPGPDPNPGTRPDRDPRPTKPDSSADIELPDGEIPAGQLPGDEAEAGVAISDEIVPGGPAETASTLPQTGGLGAGLFSAAGALLVGLGFLARLLERRRSR